MPLEQADSRDGGWADKMTHSRQQHFIVLSL